MNPLVSQLVDFIRSVGISVSFGSLEGETCFLPGILIEGGALRIDAERLRYPGDLLHEAGHIAVVPEADRATLSGPAIELRPDRAAEEMMAMAWSYAAAHHLGLDSAVVFHADGYKGGSEGLISSFATPQPIGVPMLQYTGMSYSPALAAAAGVAPFPAMQRWLRA